MRSWHPKQYVVWLILALSTLLAGCLPQTPQADSHLQLIQQRGVLRVGTLFGATTYMQAQSGETGLEYDLAHSFARYLGVELQMVPVHHIDMLFNKLEANEIDLAAAGLTPTSKRRSQFRFGPSYYQVTQKVVFKKGNRWPLSLNQVPGELVVMANSAHAEKLMEEQQQHPDLQWRESANDNSDSLLMKVLSGDIDYTLVDSTQLDSMRRFHPELSVAFSLEGEQHIAWAFADSDDDSLFGIAIEYFSWINDQGLLAEIEHKYFSHINEFDYVDTRAFIRATKRKLPRYRKLFERYAQTIDWELLAAISYQESHWNPKATSFTGVRGMMMLTQATASGVGVTDRLDPEQSIMGGAKYLEKMLARIPDKVPENERMWFALAAYNVGYGHLIDAMDITELRDRNRYSWLDVQESLPLLRKRQWYKQTKFGYARGDEPVRYVRNIRRYYETLLWLERQASRQKELERQQDRFSNITELIEKFEEPEDQQSALEEAAEAESAEQP
ncbi:membrane-bound lytic murein transglycosylase MltF [Neiella sp. HB171785]|uniref:Membrane-bound lytic murein transglycosylase F n=1 Tax=Neiella litorisoli TaxID=2771431 RepID=A0A8J6QV33_9GAMM|nr:membrane-bound lytic murein transglycosylase MltF [Neiella litorisoli]MBD1390817.1 membrane-bound lytic murein transglycosylase MltF [Neiella litorisoli]